MSFQKFVIAPAASLFLALLLLSAPSAAIAVECGADSWFGEKCLLIKKALDSGKHDLYLPFHAHHGRGTYTPERIAELNENDYGIGYGRSIVEPRNDLGSDWHSVYGMVFRDSHYKPQTVFGYGYQRYLSNDALHFGVGYTIFLTTRGDIAKGFPIPAILPLASINYKDASLMATYVPRLSGDKGNGDLLFLFGRISFK